MHYVKAIFKVIAILQDQDVLRLYKNVIHIHILQLMEQNVIQK